MTSFTHTLRQVRRKAVPAMIAILAFLVVLSISYLTILAPTADAAAPTFTITKWKNGSTNVLLTFDDILHDGVGGGLAAADFTVGGTDGLGISQVVHNPGENVVIIVLDGAMDVAGAGEVTVACASSAVFNVENEACAQGATDFNAVGQDSTAPNVIDVTYASGQDLFVGFDEVMDPSSMTTSNFTISTADGGDNETVTAVTAVNEGAMITASGANIAFGDSVTVTTNVTDLTGNASAGESPKIFPSLKISEVSIGQANSAKNEFVEIYNYGQSSVDMSNVRLHLYNHGTTTDTNMTLSRFTSNIPANGFYLISTSFFNPPDNNNSVADATYLTNSAQLVSNGAAYISMSDTANQSVIDMVGWGTSTVKEGTVHADIATGSSIERMANPQSDASSMSASAQGGDAFTGNAQDTNNNVNDFVVQLGRDPQNSQSGLEFPGGFAGEANGDQTAPTVVDSWPNASGANFVDANLSVVGIDFSEQMDVNTLNVSNIQLFADSDPGTNLCGNIDYDAFATFGAQVMCNVDVNALPLANAPHTLRVSTDVEDLARNGLGSNYEVNFTPQPSTGQNAFSFGSTQPPQVVGTFPPEQSSSYPPDGGALSVNFNQTIDSSTLAGEITLVRTADNSNVGITGASLRTIVDTDDSLDVDISGISLTAGDTYMLSLGTGITSGDGVALSETFSLIFTVAASNDSSGPVVYGSFPGDGDTNVSVNTPIVTIAIDDALDPSTVSDSTASLLQGSDALPIEVDYDATLREIQLISSTAFEPNTVYTVQLLGDLSASTIDNISGVALQDTDGSPNNTYEFTFTTGGADSTAPEPTFAIVTEGTAQVTFTEVMLEADVTDLSNWTLTSDGVTQPLSSLAGNEVTWDSSTQTASLTGFSVAPGETFVLTPASGMRDLSGNTIGSAVNLGGVVENASTCDYCNGLDAGFQDDYWETPTEFSDFGHMMPAAVWPMNQMAGFTSNYMIDFPITEQIRAAGNGGKIVFTFPSGFDVTNAAVEADSYDNNDINGFGAGTVGISAVTANASARTVTVTLDTATRCGSGNTDPCVSGDEDDYIHFDIAGIANSDVPRDWESNGYTVDIKLMTNTTLNESYTSMPFFINAAGSDDLTVDVTAGSENSGTFDVHLWCPSTGDMAQTVDFSTEGDGTAQTTFSGLPSGDYCDVWTEEDYLSINGTEYKGIEFHPVVAATATESITLGSTASLQQITVELTGAGSKDVDVFARRNDSFGMAMKTAITTTGTDSVTLKLDDGTWNIGVGPAMPMTGAWSQPPAQDYTITPNNIKVRIANPNVTESSGTADDGTITFALAAASESLTAQVVDTSGAVMTGAMVFIDSTTGGYHSGAETGIEGTVTMSVNPGTYRMGAFLPGAPPTKEVNVRVDSAGNIYQDGSTVATSTVTIELSKGDQAITGTVTDGTNPVSGAAVHAFCTANCNGYFDAHTSTGTSGTYSLYVGTGTWNVDSFSPGYGFLGQQTVAVSSGVDTGNIDFQPDTGTTFNTISGTVCKKAGGGADCSSATGLGGIEVWAHSDSGGSNFARTSDDGTYTVRVSAASGYTVEPFDPTSGPLPPISNVDVSGGNATSQDSVIDTPETVTISIEDSGSNAVTVGDMFIEFVDDTQDMKQAVFIEDASSIAADIPDGTYEIQIQMMGADVDPDSDITGAGVTTGTLVVDGSESITVTVPDLQTISGTLTDGSNPVESAFVEITDVSTGTSIGATTDNTGAYSVSVPDGSYQVTAYNPGLVLESETVTVSGGSETKNLTGDVTDQSISGAITDLNGNPVPYAFVVAEKQGGGTVAVQSDADGEYSAFVEDGTWSVSAAGHGYADKALATDVVIDGSGSASNDIAFTATDTTLADPVIQSLTPSKGGTIQDTGATGSGVAVTIPAGALSSSTNAGTAQVKETSNAVATATTDLVGNAFEITAQDAGGNALTNNFSSKVTIEQCQTVAELATAGIDTLGEMEDLTISYFSGNGTWINETTVATPRDVAENTVDAPASDLNNVTDVCFKAQVDHFTVFSITAPADGVAPAVPTGVAATGSNGSVLVTWSAVTTNADSSAISDLAGYEVYRDTSSSGSFTTQLNSSDISGTSYSDTTAAVGTTYFYKVTAADTGGQESAKSSAASGAATSGGVNIGTSGGGGGVSVPRTTINVTLPDAGDVVAGGSNETVAWTISGNATDVDVYISYDDGSTFTLVASGQSAAQDYLWAVPNLTASKVQVRVDVRNGGEVITADTSSVFSIEANQQLPVVTVGDVSSPDPVSDLFPSKDAAEASLPDDLDAGFLVKTPGLPAVYFLGGDGKRHSFPNEHVYFSWFGDFSQVREISVSKMASIGLGEPVRVRPGTWMVKIQSDPKTYAVEPSGIIRWVQTETVATDLFGDQWNKRILDVEPTMFSNYTAGVPLSNSNEHPAGMVVRDADGFAHYVAEDGKLRRFANEAAVRANFIQTRFERPAVAGDLARTAGVLINNIEDILFRYQDIGR